MLICFWTIKFMMLDCLEIAINKEASVSAELVENYGSCMKG